MEITIGVRQVARDIVFESNQTAEEVAATVNKALKDGTALELADERGRQTIVPIDALGYVQIGSETTRPVGFRTN